MVNGERPDVERHHNAWLTSLGVVGASAVAIGTGLLPTREGRVPPIWWFGHPARTSRQEAFASWTFLLGLGVLTLAWVLFVRSKPSLRTVTVTAVLWAVPFVLETPAASHDVHAYLAQGLLLDHGGNPNTTGPQSLGGGRILAAVDPVWRNSPAPYGPIALATSRLAALVGEHSQIGGLLVLRAFACLGVAVGGWCVVRLAGDRAAQALALTVASPLCLVTLVSAAHHEGLVVGFALSALLAHTRGKVLLAYVLAMAAGMVKVPGFVVLAGLVVTDLWVARTLVRTSLQAAAAGVSVTLVSWIFVPNPFGWVSALSTPGLGHTQWAPVTKLAELLPGSTHLWRLTGQVVAVLIVLALLATTRRRPALATVAWSLLAVSLLGPVIYPWYFAPPAFVLSTLEGRWPRRITALAGGGGIETGLPRLGNVAYVFGR
jgi:hypothetical protein